jgi:UDP-N-acetylglucosamine--N-acetylmuramyl-(pentapeptide) pyrophosphoryl-undecaprenol N-acetylglucosamine transferase
MIRPTILIMAGGTGGHIFPALAIADAMRSRNWTVHWLGTQNGMEKNLIPKAGYPLHTLDFEGIVGRGWLPKLLLPFRLLSALIKVRALFKRIQPQVVLGMGGYPALPGGLYAGLAKVPLIIHEQNAVPGKTNQVLAPRATKVLAAFPETFRQSKIRARVVGNPVRNGIVAVPLQRENWEGSRPLRIAIVGGSRGAQALNEVLPIAIALMPLAKRPSIIHQTGQGRAADVLRAYRQREIAADVREFIDDMAALYASVDLIICRSGASTVSELACAALPGILVPYPFHADQQQLHNARFLTSTGGAILMEQKDLSPEVLADTIAHLSPAQLYTMRTMLTANAHPESTQWIADELDVYRSAA